MERIVNSMVLTVNIWMVFILLNAFSSLILSTLINTPYTVIDSLEDLRARPELTHFVHYSFESINLIRVNHNKCLKTLSIDLIVLIQKSGNKEEIELLETGLQNTKKELVTDELKMLGARNEMKKLIIKDKTHVIVANLGHSKLIQTSVIGHKSTHISAEQRLYTLEGCVHNKYLDAFVAQKYYDM